MTAQGSLQAYRGRRVLVTGGTGFIASHLIRALVDAGATVFATRRSRRPLQSAVTQGVSFEWLDADLTRRQTVGAAVIQAKPAIIFHLAALPIGEGEDQELYEANSRGAIELAEAAQQNNVERFVYCGSCFEYGEGVRISENHALAPTSAYAVSKVTASLALQSLVRSKGLPLVVVRPFTTYGPGEKASRLIPSTVAAALAGHELAMTDGRQERDFIFVSDVVSGFLLAGSREEALGKTFNLCTGIGTTVAAVSKRVIEILGVPNRLKLGAKPHRQGEMFTQSGDNAYARAILGWRPAIDLEEGLRQSIAWARKYGQEE